MAAQENHVDVVRCLLLNSANQTLATEVIIILQVACSCSSIANRTMPQYSTIQYPYSRLTCTFIILGLTKGGETEDKSFDEKLGNWPVAKDIGYSV